MFHALAHVLAKALTASSSRTGGTIKRVTCEHCGCAYQYHVTRTVEVAVMVGLTNRGTQARLDAAGRRELERALADPADPVACPKCGLYSSAMQRSLRRRTAGWVALVLGCVLVGGHLVVAACAAAPGAGRVSFLSALAAPPMPYTLAASVLLLVIGAIRYYTYHPKPPAPQEASRAPAAPSANASAGHSASSRVATRPTVRETPADFDVR
ncbi:MAG: hypothetical protein CHACPFDD_01275 [Phycisphaerae bacterium]|nr:hypothetical protein [Phycisphaerae bacterium]